MTQLRPLKDVLETDLKATNDSPELSSTWTTLKTLQSLASPSSLDNKGLLYAVPHLTLISTNASLVDKDEDFLAKISKSLQYTEALVRADAAAAYSHTCSSVLAGHASESDEYGDVGLWISSDLLGDVQDTHDQRALSRAVLSAIGLDALLDAQGGQVRMTHNAIVEPVYPSCFRLSPLNSQATQDCRHPSRHRRETLT